MIAQQFSVARGHQVVVDNRPAVDGVVGTEFAARSAPHDYRLIIVTSSHFMMLRPDFKQRMNLTALTLWAAGRPRA